MYKNRYGSIPLNTFCTVEHFRELIKQRSYIRNRNWILAKYHPFLKSKNFFISIYTQDHLKTLTKRRWNNFGTFEQPLDNKEKMWFFIDHFIPFFSFCKMPLKQFAQPKDQISHKKLSFLATLLIWLKKEICTYTLTILLFVQICLYIWIECVD